MNICTISSILDPPTLGTSQVVVDQVIQTDATGESWENEDSNEPPSAFFPGHPPLTTYLPPVCPASSDNFAPPSKNSLSESQVPAQGDIQSLEGQIFWKPFAIAQICVRP